MFDTAKIREDFPILKTKIHGKNLVYFDNAATTQKPQQVIDCITSFYTDYNSNIHRGIHYLSQESTRLYEEARSVIQKYINAASSHEVIFTKGLTEAVNLVAYSFGETFIKPGDEIIITAMEHHANIVPWQLLCERKDAILRIVHFNDDGVLDIDEYKSLFNEKTKIASFTYASNVLGTKNPVKEMIDIAHSHDVPVFVDGAQSLQHEKIDVQELDCDFYAIAGHKTYAPTGIGALYGKEKWLDLMVPYQGGGDMIETVTLEKTTFNSLPFKFEAGTTNYVGASALAKAIEYIDNIGVEAVGAHEDALLQHATKQIEAMDGITIYGRSPEKASVLSFLVEGAHPADIGMILDKQGIAVRTGTHCAEPIMQYYGIPGTIRASFAMYNTIEETDYFAEMLDKVRKMFL